MPAVFQDLPTFAMYVFIAFVVTVICGAVFLLRSSLGQSLSATVAQHAKTYAVAYVKGTVLMLIAMIASFDESFEKLTIAQAATLAWWNWAILYLKPISAACAVLVAFLDRSIQRATDAKDASSKSNPPFSPAIQ